MVKGFLAVIAFGMFTLSGASQDASFPAGLTHRAGPNLERGAGQPSTLSVTVPAETVVSVQMLSGIHSQISRVDDLVTAQLIQPVYVDGRVALPSGSLLDGHITMLRPAGRLRRPAELAFRFEEITLPDGQRKSISAVLSSLEKSRILKTRLDSEGYLQGTRGSAWKALVGGLVGASTFATIRAAVAGSAALTYIAPASGAALLGYEILWIRGNEVHLPPDTRCRVRLNDPLTVRVQW